MTPRGFAVLACRLAAVMLLAYALQWLAFNLQTFLAPGIGAGARILSFGLGMFAQLAGAALLWFGASRIAAGIADEPGPSPGAGLDERTFIRAGTALIGLVVALLAAVSGLVHESMLLLREATPELAAGYVNAMRLQVLEQRVDYLARLGLGILLILGRDRIAGWLGAARSTR